MMKTVVALLKREMRYLRYLRYLMNRHEFTNNNLHVSTVISKFTWGPELQIMLDRSSSVDIRMVLRTSTVKSSDFVTSDFADEFLGFVPGFLASEILLFCPPPITQLTTR